MAGPAVGAPLKLRYRIALRRGGCRYPQQTVVTYEMPMEETVKSPENGTGLIQWHSLDCWHRRKPDAAENYSNAYVKLGRHREGVVGFAEAICSRRTSTFGVTHLEKHRNHSDRASARGRRALLRAFRLEAVDNDNLDQRTFRRRKDDAR